MTDYERFLEGLQLRHFSPGEITSYAERERDGVKNALPARKLWENLVPTLWVVDQLRHLLGLPVTLTSIYRAPAYNAAVGGADFSFHMRNQAIDLQARDVPSWQVFDTLRDFRQSGAFTGGLGLYKTFVHIDTRGENATWDRR